MFTEFLNIFREQTHAKANKASLVALESMSESEAGDDELMTVHAKIPGGLYDSEKLSPSTENEMLK